MIRINHEISIEDWEITESFHRASGPGGQNVNKVSTAVELRFEASNSPNLSEVVKARLQKLSGQKWTKEGAVIITAEKHRSQAMNRDLAREKLIELIKRAYEKPKPRIKTRPSFSAKRKRMDKKKQRGEIKTLRKRITDL